MNPLPITVQDLIDKLNLIDDKTQPIMLSVQYGRDCSCCCTNFDVTAGHKDDNGRPYTLIGGDENEEHSTW